MLIDALIAIDQHLDLTSPFDAGDLGIENPAGINAALLQAHIALNARELHYCADCCEAATGEPAT